MNDLVTTQPTNAELFRASTDAAGLSREIVLKTALEIQGRKYVKVEGWQAIATAHGCAASSCDVVQDDDGVSAMGEVRRMSDGALIARAEGFVGADEPTWYGGDVQKEEWEGPKGNRRRTGRMITTTLPKRPDYAIRAMAQTRAISRACRSAFAYVVVMIDENLSTTPAEEVPEGGFNDHNTMRNVTPQNEGDPQIRTNPEDRQERPSEVQLRVTAMMTEITSADDRATLNKFLRENKKELDTWGDESEPYQAVVRHFNQRLKAVSAAPDKSKEPANQPPAEQQKTQTQEGGSGSDEKDSFRSGGAEGVAGNGSDGGGPGREASGATQSDQGAQEPVTPAESFDLDDEIPFS